MPPTPSGPQSLAMLAQALGGTLVGNGETTVRQLVHPLMFGHPEDLVFIMDPEALAVLHKAPVQAAILAEGIPVPEALLQSGPLKGVVVVKRPRHALAILLNLFDKPPHSKPGIHPSAVVDPTATVHPTASIGPFVAVGENAAVGENTVLMAHVTVGAEAKIAAGCLLHPGVRVGERVMIGNRVIIHHNASIGADGFSFVTPEQGSIESARASGGKIEAQNTDIIRINSVGTVILEDDVEVGACSTIDRATLGATIIRRGTKIDNLVTVGHNNTIGQNCLIVAQVGISGSCTIGDRVVIAGQSGLKDHTRVGNDAIIMAKSGVMNDIPEKSIYIGIPARPQREAFQNFAYIDRIRDIHKDMIALKKRVAELEAQRPGESPDNTASEKSMEIAGV